MSFFNALLTFIHCDLIGSFIVILHTTNVVGRFAVLQ